MIKKCLHSPHISCLQRQSIISKISLDLHIQKSFDDASLVIFEKYNVKASLRFSFHEKFRISQKKFIVLTNTPATIHWTCLHDFFEIVTENSSPQKPRLFTLRDIQNHCFQASDLSISTKSDNLIVWIWSQNLLLAFTRIESVKMTNIAFSLPSEIC